MEKDISWLIERYASASVIRKVYLVIAHSIRVDGVNISAWLETKERFE